MSLQPPQQQKEWPDNSTTTKEMTRQQQRNNNTTTTKKLDFLEFLFFVGDSRERKEFQTRIVFNGTI
jgi:hypothetical protein